MRVSLMKFSMSKKTTKLSLIGARVVDVYDNILVLKKRYRGAIDYLGVDTTNKQHVVVRIPGIPKPTARIEIDVIKVCFERLKEYRLTHESTRPQNN